MIVAENGQKRSIFSLRGGGGLNISVNNTGNGLAVDDFGRYGNFANLIKTNVEIENSYTKDLSVMYLAHINFRPELNGELCYSATKESPAGSDYKNDKEDTGISLH